MERQSLPKEDLGVKAMEEVDGLVEVVTGVEMEDLMVVMVRMVAIMVVEVNTPHYHQFLVYRLWLELEVRHVIRVLVVVVVEDFSSMNSRKNICTSHGSACNRNHRT